MSVFYEWYDDGKTEPPASLVQRGGHRFNVEYEGATLDGYSEGMGFGDSQGRALVWDEQEQRIKSVSYYYSGLGGSDYNFYEVDATPEVLAKAIAWAEPRLRNIYGMPMLEGIASEVRANRRVRLTGKMRFIPVGATGLAVWSGRTRNDDYRTKVRWDDGTESWVGTHLLEVEDWKANMPDDAEQRAEGNYQAHKMDFIRLFK